MSEQRVSDERLQAVSDGEAHADPRDLAVYLLDARSEIARLTSVVEAAETLYAHLRRAIEDIDAHATPLGEDGDGFVAVGYAVSVGSLHRALAVARGTLPSPHRGEPG